MAKYTDTDLGLNVKRQGSGETRSIGYASQNVVGKSGIEELADALKSVNPAITAVAKKGITDKNEADFEQGKALINGITLDEARELNKQGYPEIFNGWARYGAKVQYATNATSEFIESFKQEYLENSKSPNYDWRSAYDKASRLFFQDKQGDNEFAKAYNEKSNELQKWANVQEFEKQSNELKMRTESNTQYSLSNIGRDILSKMKVDFFNQAGLYQLNAEDYKKNQAKFFSKENMYKYFMEEFKNIKDNRPANIDLSTFDDIVLRSAESHAKTGGELSDFYATLIKNPRNDGTPSIIDNPKKNKEALRVLKLLDETVATNKFALNADLGRAGATVYDNKTYKDLSGKLFNNSIKQEMIANGGNRRVAVATTIDKMSNILKLNRPVESIKEILEQPIGNEPSNTNLIALDTYMQLDKHGVIGKYFDKVNVNSTKWFMISELVKNGTDPREAIRKVGNWEANTVGKFDPIKTEDRQALFNKLGIKATQDNIELVVGLATYFKNIEGRGGDYVNRTKKYFEQHYDKIPNREVYINKNTLAELGVNKNQYDEVVEFSVGMFQEKFKDIPNFVKQTNPEKSKFTNDPFDEIGYTTVEQPDFQYNITNYEVTVDAKNNKLYLINKDDNILGSDAPMVFTDKKTGVTMWAELPLDEVTKAFSIKRNADLQKQANLKRAKANERIERMNTKKRRIKDLSRSTVYSGFGETPNDYGNEE